MSEGPRLIDRFDETARRHPQAVALIAGGEQMTYAQLGTRAERAARDLARSVSHGARVGLIAARDVDTYVGYLAILRSGRTVVPLNPAFPHRRTQQVLAQAGVAAVIGPAERIGRLPAPWRPGRTPAGITGPLHVWDGPDYGSEPGGTAAPSAYILFTSGTTGVPKGIPISDANVCTMLDYVCAIRPVEPGDRVSQCFDLTFDPSVADMFTAWGAGATLVVPTTNQLNDPVAFVSAFHLTHWSSVPSVISLARRMRQLSPGCMPGLRSSLFAGEALTAVQARDWLTAAPRCRIWNAYGPTEMTIFCSAYQLPADVEAWPVTSNGTVPIGTPFPTVRWRIAADPEDEGRRELWLSGPQRFRGYLDPAWDQHAFTPPPPAGRAPAPAAFYRTGDNVAETPDGLVHLGRIDQQVQVNGYRVELSEVEGALRAHPGVQEAVAVLSAGELVAVYTGAAVDIGAVLDTVAARLPPYMVPGRLWRESELPLNDNGKIDRGRLVAYLQAGRRAQAAR